MNDPLRDLTNGVVRAPGLNFTSMTIGGVTYVKDGDNLRPATDEEIVAIAERKAARDAEKAARKAAKQTSGAPSITIGDVAGGDIIHTTITINSK